MDINTLRQWIAERDSISILETVDVHTGTRSDPQGVRLRH